MNTETVYEYPLAIKSSKLIAYLAVFIGILLSAYNISKSERIFSKKSGYPREKKLSKLQP
jgi:hypothetical protein